MNLYFEMKNLYSVDMRGAISAKGQVTIPKDVRDALRLAPGDVIDFTVEGDQIIGRKRRVHRDLGPFLGIFADGRATDQVLGELRPVRAWDDA